MLHRHVVALTPRALPYSSQPSQFRGQRQPVSFAEHRSVLLATEAPTHMLSSMIPATICVLVAYRDCIGRRQDLLYLQAVRRTLTILA